VTKLTNRTLVGFLIALSVDGVLAQTNTITQRANNVKCGNVVVLQGGTVKLSCSGLTKEQAALLQTTIPTMLETLLETNQQEFADIKAMVRELHQGNQTGNLKERAVALSAEIMKKMYQRGWMEGRVTLPPGVIVVHHEPGPSASSEEQLKYIEINRGYFRFRFAQQLLNMHQEFAELHLHDYDLDQFSDEFQRVTAEYPNRPTTAQPFLPPYSLTQMQDVAQSLVKLANQL
jgi:hypothetical protein